MSAHEANPGTPRVGTLFVCLGNICRSPLARCIFEHQSRERDLAHRFLVDSCGTGGWHIGRPADPRSVAVALAHGLTLTHRARTISPTSDFQRFDYLLAMDRDNRDSMLARGAPASRVFLMRSFDPTLSGEPEHRLDVPDPYHGGDDGFQKVYDMLWRACEGLLEQASTHAPRAPLPPS